MFQTFDIESLLINEEYEMGLHYHHQFFSDTGKLVYEIFDDSPNYFATWTQTVVAITTHINEPMQVRINTNFSQYQDRYSAAGTLRKFFYRAPIGVGRGKAKFIKGSNGYFYYKIA